MTNALKLCDGARSAPVGTGVRASVYSSRQLGISVGWKSLSNCCFGSAKGGRDETVDLGRLGRRVAEAIAVARHVDQMVMPDAQPPVGAEAGAHVMETGRPIVVVPHVVFARPDHLHGRTDRLRQVRGLGGVVRRQPPSEAAADARHLDRHRLARDAEDPGNHLRSGRRHLQRPEDLAAAVVHVRDAVLRLERRVRQKRRLVDHVDLGARRERTRARHRPGRRAPCLASTRARGTAPTADALDSSRPVAFVPRDAQRLTPLHRRPRRIGDDGDARLQPRRVLVPLDRDDAFHARHGQRSRRIDACGTAAVDRTFLDDRVEHALACARRDRRSAAPTTILGVSTPRIGVPTIVWRPTSLSAGASFGTGSVAAVAASSP